MREFEYWRGALGAIVLALVLVFPEGIAGFLRDRFGDRFGRCLAQ